jgi:hypothetical protein
LSLKKSDDEPLCIGYLKTIGLDLSTWKAKILLGDLIAKVNSALK